MSLVARGRERQGKLAEAFDHYRAFASLGDNKQLVSISDEPNGQTRPDVWARGRIDAMIRNVKDPTAQKTLDQRVQKEWDALRATNDLVRLREFVKMFGPFFMSGREAQLLLADLLMQTNNEDDTREAQTQLMQLYATCEDRTIAARATETLARLLIRRGMARGKVEVLLTQGRKRFGPPTAEVEAALRAMREKETERLDRMVDRILDATGWDDLLATE